MSEEIKKLVTEMNGPEVETWTEQFGAENSYVKVTTPNGGWDEEYRILFTPEQFQEAIEGAMKEAEDAIVYPKNFSPSIMDCDGIPQAMKDVILSKGSMESLANLYLLIDTWAGKQRKYVEDSLRPPEDIDCPVCEDGKLIASRYHWCNKCTVSVGTTDDVKLNALVMRAHEGVELPEEAVLMDTKQIHSAVLKLKIDPKENERVRFGFNCGIHSAAAIVAQFHNFKK